MITNWGSLVVLCRVFIAVVLALFVVWIALDTSKRPEQLISFGGICIFILLQFLLSAHRTAVSCTAWSCHGDSPFIIRRDVIIARYLWLLLLRPGISFALVPLSSLVLSLELAELLPCNSSEFYGDCNLLISLVLFFCFLLCRCHGGPCFGVWGFSSVLGSLLLGPNLD